MIKDLFVPYEQSLQLKELGFDEPCFGIWIGRGSKYDVMYVAKQEDAWMAEQNDGILAPIFAQAFEFLLEKYNLYAVIIPTVTMHWTFKTMTIANGMIDIPPYKNVDGNDYNSSKETELASLEKLIEIVKSI
jgi:hypothetical protein